MPSTSPKTAVKNQAEEEMQMKEQEGESVSTSSISRASLEPALGKTLDNVNGAWR